MPYFSIAWTLLLLGMVAFVVSLLISMRRPSRAQMLLMWLGLVLVAAALVTVVKGPHG